MNSNQALWEKGDFTAIAAFMRESGETVVESLGVRPPLRALDLGCGDGTTAVPLARLGAEVAGVDIARNLVKAGNKRAAEQGLRRLRFQEGDASNLQAIDDDTFDLTISVFGVAIKGTLPCGALFESFHGEHSSMKDQREDKIGKCHDQEKHPENRQTLGEISQS